MPTIPKRPHETLDHRIDSFIAELYTRGIRMRKIVRRIREKEAAELFDDEFDGLIEKYAALLNWFSEQRQTSRGLFKKYLQLS